MKPNPLALLNHLTLPLIRATYLSFHAWRLPPIWAALGISLATAKITPGLYPVQHGRKAGQLVTYNSVGGLLDHYFPRSELYCQDSKQSKIGYGVGFWPFRA